MLLFREHGILEERSRALAVGIAGNDQHAFAGANVAHRLARLGEIGASLAAFEMTFQVGVFEAGLASWCERVSDAKNDESSTLGRIENAGAIGEAAGLTAELADLPVVSIKDLDRLDGLRD